MRIRVRHQVGPNTSLSPVDDHTSQRCRCIIDSFAQE